MKSSYASKPASAGARLARCRLTSPAAALALAFILGGALAHANPFYSPPAEAAAPAPPAPAAKAVPAPLVALQLRFRESLAEAFGRATESEEGAESGARRAALAVLGIAFVYGLAHAAGPGHRKTVVFSLFIGAKAKAWEPMAAGFLSALTHTASGGLVIGVLSLVRGAVASLTSAETALAWADGGSLLILALIAAALIVNKLRHFSHAHDHGPSGAGRGRYAVVFLTSLVPCTGSIMVMLFALYLGSPLLGVAALLFIALGQGLVVSAAAYLAWFGRERFFNAIKRRERAVAAVSGGLELASYALILAFSLYTAWPFLGFLKELVVG